MRVVDTQTTLGQAAQSRGPFPLAACKIQDAPEGSPLSPPSSPSQAKARTRKDATPNCCDCDRECEAMAIGLVQQWMAPSIPDVRGDHLPADSPGILLR